ncbi:MAG: hypothetical protein JJU29_03395 [Verrucomicrobia bacterium]|nr:hypothetical protein [Verrucomicrobiota bacterium]MCH8512541.1 hypothetical protein [Kiritimatiellia bacterium]
MAELRKNCRRNFEAAQADRHRLRTRENSEELADVTDWLDHLAGPNFPAEGATVHFSDDVWKSASRRGEVFDDISG